MNTSIATKTIIALCLSLFIGSAHAKTLIPGESFDLKKWKLTLPMDSDHNNKLDEVNDTHLAKFTFTPFFFSTKKGEMIFISPTKVVSKEGVPLKPRSELRQMLRKRNTNIKTTDEKNNFALKANKRSRHYGSVGTRLEATLAVTHVPKSAVDPNMRRAYTVVIGQINTLQHDSRFNIGSDFGHGNEPLKIYYKKWPHHETGSLFWTYERNLPANDPNRDDVVYPVWGKTWDSKEFPDYEGIALGEEFSYIINIYENTLELTFMADDRDSLTYIMNLNDNVNAYGEVDEKDNPRGYEKDGFYLRVGAYNQCTAKEVGSNWANGCTGTGHWPTDFKNGDFSSLRFTKFKLGKPKPISKPKN